MIRKLAFFLAAVLMLAGCQTDQPTVVTTTKYKVVIPPDVMYRCPSINNLPDPETLTDIQVGRLLEQLSETNAVCRASIQQVRIYLNKAKKEVER